MKINMYQLFDNLDLKNTSRISGETVHAEYDSDMADRVQANVLSRLGAQNDKARKLPFKRKVFSVKRIIAVAAAFVIVCSSVSVGAAVYFKPDSALAEYFTFNDEVDMSTLGQDVNITETSGGYAITLKQVLSDNSTFHFVFECPEENGRLIVPAMVDLRINGEYYFDGYGSTTYFSGDHTCSIIIHNLRNIKNNDSITVEVNSAAYYDNKTKEYCPDDDVKGEWNFTFHALRANVKTKLEPLGTIKGSDSEYEIKKLTVSPLGIYIDYKQINANASDTVSGLAGDQTDITASGGAFAIVELNDGTVYSDKVGKNDFDMSISGTAVSDTPYEGTVDITFKNIINVEDIKSITVDNCVIYEK